MLKEFGIMSIEIGKVYRWAALVRNGREKEYFFITDIFYYNRKKMVKVYKLDEPENVLERTWGWANSYLSEIS